MDTVAIIGGGFSGTMTAVNLARLGTRPLRVCLINGGHPTGRGVAYGTRRPEHLLNVVARNMSAFPDHPTHFLDWLRTRTEYADLPDPVLRDTFAPRRVYGDYLQAVLFAYHQPVDGRTPVRIELVDDTAADVVNGPDGVVVSLVSGDQLDAKRVVLATGNQRPTPLPAPGGPFRHPAYVEDPWADWTDRLTRPDRDVILIGTGLTMVDVFLTLTDAGWRGTVHAVSRHGLLPQPHFRGIDYPNFPPPEPERLGLAGLAGQVEHHCGWLRQMGANPAICVDKLRPHTQKIWRQFSTDEKRQFLTRYAARWNVTRHRIAESVHARLAEAVSSSRLRVHTGRVAGLADAGSSVRVTLERDGEAASLEGGLVVNCTGPQAGVSSGADPLFAALLARGMVQADALDLGIRVGDDFAVVELGGASSKFMYALGPLLRGSLWETTAVPELRGQAMRVAQVLLQDLHATPEPAVAFTPTTADVIEYCI